MSENEVMETLAENTGDRGLIVARDPEVVLREAKKAATSLMHVVSQKKKPVIMNGEQYLEFEDWQTLGRFYGLVVRVTRTTFLDMGGVKGWEASADVVRVSDGAVLSSADSMCLNDEEKWSTRAKYEYQNGERVKVGEIPVPLFQLRSMAQTRACAKAFRNVLAWVAVLAGFKPTPAEEMTDGLDNKTQATKPAVNMPQAKSQSTSANAPTGPIISEAQGKRLYAIAHSNGWTQEDIIGFLAENFAIDSISKIAREYYDDIVSHFQEPKPRNEE